MKRLTLILSILLLLLVGCATEEPDPTPTPVPPTPTPTPEEWLEQAVAGWNELESFHFTLALEERQIELDEGGTLSFSEVEGDVQAPNRVQAETPIQTPFGSTVVAFIAIGEQQWLTNPLTGNWEEAPPNMQAEVTGMFDAETGIGAILAEMENLERLPDETVEDTTTIHLRGNLPGVYLSDFATNLPETATVDLWFNPSDRYLRQVLITEPDSGATWTFTFSQFNGDVEIEPPL